MSIEAFCTPHPNLRSVWIIFCEDTPWRQVHTSVFGRRPLLPKGCHSLEEFADQFHAMEYQHAKNYALKRLSLQAMLSTALARSLKERCVSESTIRCIIEDLARLGLVNDEEWTASFIRGVKKKKIGPRTIAQKLAAKGIRGDTLERFLKHSGDAEEQKTAIHQLLDSRYMKRNLSNPKEKQKVITSLARRGFDLPLILEAVNGRRQDKRQITGT